MRKPPPQSRFPVRFFSLLLVLFCSCDLLRESPFEVEGWTPGPGYHSPGSIDVSLLFTSDPDRSSVEYGFALTEDGQVLKGSFLWAGRLLRFLPAAELEPNKNYLLSLSAGAHDARGVSLDRAFEVSFTTRPGNASPEVLAMVPPDDGVLTDPRAELYLTFSVPVNIDSCVNSISLSPAMAGAWRLENQGSLAIFTPAEPWTWGRRYRLRVSADFQSALGIVLGREYLSRFILGEDRLPPALIAAHAVDTAGNTVFALIPQEAAAPFTENGLWESAYRLRLDFSEPVDTASLKNCLTLEPVSADPVGSLVMETPPGYASSVLFALTEKPAWGSRFLFRLKSGVRDEEENESGETVLFRVCADGPYSKPPLLVGIRLPMDPGAADELVRRYTPADAFGELPLTGGSGAGTNAWIELYFDTAPGAGVDLFSLMYLFRLAATNGALSFSPRDIRSSDFSHLLPPPEWEAYYRLEIQGLLLNGISSGMVTFYVGAGLLDTLGNRNAGIFRLPLYK
jgi:hypothetical protein